MIKRTHNVYSPVFIGLFAATILTSNGVVARGLLPAQPSVEVRLGALRVLERSVAAERMVQQQPSVMAQDVPAQTVIPFKPSAAYVPPSSSIASLQEPSLVAPAIIAPTDLAPPPADSLSNPPAAISAPMPPPAPLQDPNIKEPVAPAIAAPTDLAPPPTDSLSNPPAAISAPMPPPAPLQDPNIKEPVAPAIAAPTNLAPPPADSLSNPPAPISAPEIDMVSPPVIDEIEEEKNVLPSEEAIEEIDLDSMSKEKSTPTSEIEKDDVDSNVYLSDKNTDDEEDEEESTFEKIENKELFPEEVIQEIDLLKEQEQSEKTQIQDLQDSPLVAISKKKTTIVTNEKDETDSSSLSIEKKEGFQNTIKEEEIVIREVPVAPEIKEEAVPLEVVEEEAEVQPEEVTQEVDLDALLAKEENAQPVAQEEIVVKETPAAPEMEKEEVASLEVVEEKADPALASLEELLPEPEIPQEEPDFEALESATQETERSPLPPLPSAEKAAPEQKATTEKTEEVIIKEEQETLPELQEEVSLLEEPLAPVEDASKEEEKTELEVAIMEVEEKDKSSAQTEPLDTPPAMEEKVAPMEMPTEEAIDEAAIEEIMQESPPLEEVEIKEGKAEEATISEEEDPIKKALPVMEDATIDPVTDTPKDIKEDAPPVMNAEKAEKPTGWLPSLSKGFSSFLGGKQKQTTPEPVSAEEVTTTPALPTSVSGEEEKENTAQPSKVAEKTLPSLPSFGDDEEKGATQAEPLPELPNFTADAPAAMSANETDAPLPELPFDDSAQKIAQKEMAAPADEEIEIASLPQEAPATLAAIPAEPLAKGKALSVVFSQAETEVPLSAQQPLVDLSKKIVADTKAQVKIIAYAAGSKDQASIARRISLARALSVRALLIDLGVDNVRISVQAMGNNISDGEPERADIVLSD